MKEPSDRRQTRRPDLLRQWPWFLTAGLIALPPLAFCAFGALALWRDGQARWLWWTAPICWTLAALLVRLLPRPAPPALPPVDSSHWTERDREANELLGDELARFDADLQAGAVVDFEQLQTRILRLAARLAGHYHAPAPAAPLDAFDRLTVVELLAVANLVASDLEAWTLGSVPLSHRFTVGRIKLAQRLPDWWRGTAEASWVVSTALNPLGTLVRYVATKAAGGPVKEYFKVGAYGALHRALLQRTGEYLIEVYSGRLRGGSAAYRAALRSAGGPLEPLEPRASSDPPAGTPGSNRVALAADAGLARDSGAGAAERFESPTTVTIAVVGQVGAGKSSLVNGLSGERRAAVDELPSTRDSTAHAWTIEEANARIELLDTPGYDSAGATDDQFEAVVAAACRADLILLVAAANSPAKDADDRLLRRIDAWFAEHRQWKRPAKIAVVSKIDLLRPPLEWEPPYDWRSPTRPKERSIAAAVEFARQTFGERVDSVWPVSLDGDANRRAWIDDGLEPAIVVSLEAARATALVRSLHERIDDQTAGLWRRQLRTAVAGLFRWSRR